MSVFRFLRTRISETLLGFSNIHLLDSILGTAPKMKFSIKDFFSKYDQIRRFLQICSHLLKKPLMENFIFCAVACDLGLYGEKNHVFHDRGGIFMGEKVTIKSIEILSP